VEAVDPLRPQALVAVAAAAGQARVPLGHEGRHDAEAWGDLFDRGLEQRRAIGGLQGRSMKDRRLEHARTGLGVQALDGDAERGEFVHQRGEERPVLRHAHQRIAEHARSQRCRLGAGLGGEAVGRLAEVEPLEFHPAARGVTHPRRAVQHPAQGLARADRQWRARRVDEFPQEERHVAVPRHGAPGGEVDARLGVGIAAMPAGEGAVVIADVARIPAEDHIAETETAIERGEELVLVQILAAQDAIDVGDRHLDLADRRPADRFDDRFGCAGADIGCGHANPLAGRASPRGMAVKVRRDRALRPGTKHPEEVGPGVHAWRQRGRTPAYWMKLRP